MRRKFKKLEKEIGSLAESQVGKDLVYSLV